MAHAINAEGPRLLAEACGAHGVDRFTSAPITFSTARKNGRMYRLTCPSPWGSMQTPNAPVSWRLKLTGALVGGSGGWLCDTRGQNFMQTMLRLGQSGKALRVVNVNTAFRHLPARLPKRC